MNVQNVTLHNVDGLVERPNGGMLLTRVPESLYSKISERGKREMFNPTNSEIRFTADSDEIAITLSAEGGAVYGILSHGPFMTRERLEIGEQSVTLHFSRGPYLRECLKANLHHGPFNPRLWRFQFAGGSGNLVFHSVEGEGIAPATPEDTPKLRYLAYGTSLTAGRAATGPHLTYAYQTAWRLGADLINLGSGGSCFCEPEWGDYLASRQDWDIATLGLSLNMLSWDQNDFKTRIHSLISKVVTAHPDKPIACITNWPCFNDHRLFPASELKEGERAENKPASESYRMILRETVEALNAPNLHLLEGPELFPTFAGLSDDLIHPSDLGMIEMAENLAKRLKPLI